jgi:hypothetical protein
MPKFIDPLFAKTGPKHSFQSFVKSGSINLGTRLFLQLSKLGLSTPSTAWECALSPFGSGGDTLVYGRGGGGGPNFDEGTNTVIL